MRCDWVTCTCVNDKSKKILIVRFSISTCTILTDPRCLSIHGNCYTEDCVCNCLTANKMNVKKTQPNDTCTCR